MIFKLKKKRAKLHLYTYTGLMKIIKLKNCIRPNLPPPLFLLGFFFSKLGKVYVVVTDYTFVDRYDEFTMYSRVRSRLILTIY